ncbi:MAG TPA: hypothetical protein VF138_03960 [Caulobacteraceae bacterium]
MRAIIVGTMAMAMLGAAVAPAAAETFVRLQNDSVHPSNATLGKRSRDIRPRKAFNFPIEDTSNVLSIIFASGQVGRGDLDVSEAAPFTDPADGNDYYCVSYDEDGPTVNSQAQCEALVTKGRK